MTAIHRRFDKRNTYTIDTLLSTAAGAGLRQIPKPTWGIDIDNASNKVQLKKLTLRKLPFETHTFAA